MVDESKVLVEVKQESGGASTAFLAKDAFRECLKESVKEKCKQRRRQRGAA